MSQRTEIGINLNNVLRNSETEKYFVLAARTGDKNILSLNDILSYGIYQDRFIRCGNNDGSLSTESCQRRVAFWDNDMIWKGTYDPENIREMLVQIPLERRAVIIQGAILVMVGAVNVLGKYYVEVV